jgi:hypothetical protein
VWFEGVVAGRAAQLRAKRSGDVLSLTAEIVTVIVMGEEGGVMRERGSGGVEWWERVGGGGGVE